MLDSVGIGLSKLDAVEVILRRLDSVGQTKPMTGRVSLAVLWSDLINWIGSYQPGALGSVAVTTQIIFGKWKWLLKIIVSLKKKCSIF